MRAGVLKNYRGQLFEIGIEPSYAHVEGLDEAGADVGLGWIRAIRHNPGYGFISLGGGFRQEWLGSFREVRYPVGAGLGVGLLVAPSAGVRFEYRYRRVLHDPVADYSEHQLMAAVSIFLRNRGRSSRP